MTSKPQNFDPAVFMTPEYWLDPYPALKVLRDHYPLYHDEKHGQWYITRYDDVVNAFRDNNVHYSNRLYADFMGIVFGTTMMQFDGTEHTQRRNVVAPEFVGKKLETLLPIIEKNTQELIDKFTLENATEIAEKIHQAGEVDLIDAFSARLPIKVIIDMLGLPQKDHATFNEWYPAMMDGLSGDKEQRALGIEANQAFHAYIDRLVDERSVDPADDLISRLCVAEVDGARMDKEDIKAFASLLLVAGGETTDKVIASMWYHLMKNPDQLSEVQKDPNLMERVFVETMRLTAPAGSQTREVISPVELYGQTIPVGAEVHLSIYGGNHDDRVFKDPDVFNIFREDLYFGRDLRTGYYEGGQASHLGFGLGKHFCVGYQLARSEAVIGSKALLEVMKNPQLKPGTQARAHTASPFLGVPKLELVYEPA